MAALLGCRLLSIALYYELRKDVRPCEGFDATSCFDQIELEAKASFSQQAFNRSFGSLGTKQ